MSLFSEKKPLREAIDFYKHKEGWTNRLIAGDSLLVMNSLLEKEGMAGKAQMVYFDPPYGIKYGSNFQPFVNKRDVKEKDEDLTAEPEMLKAFRDTWELGIHSYLTYLRDRLKTAYSTLDESGSIFIQIGIDNQHYVRAILDEIYGPENFISLISYATTTLTSKLLDRSGDYIVWYAKSKENMKYRDLFVKKDRGRGTPFTWVEEEEEEDGTRRPMTDQELDKPEILPKNSKTFGIHYDLLSLGYTQSHAFMILILKDKHSKQKLEVGKPLRKECNNSLKRTEFLYQGKLLGICITGMIIQCKK